MATQRDEENLQKLLKLSKLDLDQQQRRLADLQAAHASAQASMDWLAQSVRQEEVLLAKQSQPDLSAFQGFFNDVSEKKSTLEATLATLLSEICEARQGLKNAHGESQKLEHLLERRVAAAKKRIIKKEAEAIGDMATQMASRMAR